MLTYGARATVKLRNTSPPPARRRGRAHDDAQRPGQPPPPLSGLRCPCPLRTGTGPHTHDDAARRARQCLHGARVRCDATRATLAVWLFAWQFWRMHLVPPSVPRCGGTHGEKWPATRENFGSRRDNG
eukprot:scaffold781_cov123-Isochrysis_galbana.AAC.2